MVEQGYASIHACIDPSIFGFSVIFLVCARLQFHPLVHSERTVHIGPEQEQERGPDSRATQCSAEKPSQFQNLHLLVLWTGVPLPGGGPWTSPPPCRPSPATCLPYACHMPATCHCHVCGKRNSTMNTAVALARVRRKPCANMGIIYGALDGYLCYVDSGISCPSPTLPCEVYYPSHI